MRERRTFAKRLTVKGVLEKFGRAVQARAIDAFWDSRKNGRLKPKPESIGAGLLGVFAVQALAGRGLVIKESQSGTGYVDIALVMRSATLHLVELKIHKGGAFLGPSQLAHYMRNEGRHEGWLVVFDARPPGRNGKPRLPLPTHFDDKAGKIHVLAVEINPQRPSAARPS